MASFLLLDASDQVITLAWEREPEEGGRAIVEEVQMKTATMDSEGQQEQGDGDKGSEWKTLSSSLKSGALRKKNLEPGTAYVFRRRARKVRASEMQADSDTSTEEMEEWGAWSEPSGPFHTLAQGVRQAPTPLVKLREGGAVVMEWSPVPGASAYEVRMSTSGKAWSTIAPAFASTLLRKKGLRDATQYRFSIRPVFARKEGGVSGDSGDAWAWSPASALVTPAVLNSFLSSQIPQELVVGGGGNEMVGRMTLAGKIVAFYFSASWCGPCRKYTPLLAQLYLAAKKQHKAFEVVFVSLDGDGASFAKYHSTMPWPAIPYDHSFREDFASSKGVNSIPRLIVTGRNGQELASNAVGMTWDQLVAWEAQG